MDPNNPIVRLCVEGMQAEGTGKMEAARLLFTQAWDQSRDHYEACMAAHYLARHQTTPEQTLHWNQEALDRASQVQGNAVAEFYPSLYLNLAKSHEDLGNQADARKYYELASVSSRSLSDTPYAKTVRNAIMRGTQRVSG